MAKLIKNDSQRVKSIPDASIPPSTVFTGDIDTAGGVRIDGTVKGKVSAGGDVTVGIDGVIEGSAKACHVNIAGKIIGNVTATGAVQMLSGSKLVGDLTASSFAIEQGAYYKGQCTITDGQEKPMLTASKETAEPAADKAEEAKTAEPEVIEPEAEDTEAKADEAEVIESEEPEAETAETETAETETDGAEKIEETEQKSTAKSSNRRRKFQKH